MKHWNDHSIVKSGSSAECHTFSVNRGLVNTYVNLDYRSQLTEADELYILLTDLFEQHQFPSLIENSDNEREDEVIYMKEKCVEKGFDDENNQIKPLAMTVKTTRLKVLIEAVQGKGIFRLEVGCVDEQQIIQLWLHRQS
ncbi:hypothetical protein ACNO5E_25645 [Vibrio parahaemolyticus]